MTRIGPVVKWKCQFCNWEAEGPWIYSPWPPINLEEYYAWLDLVEGIEEGTEVPCVCYECHERGLGLDILDIREKMYLGGLSDGSEEVL